MKQLRKALRSKNPEKLIRQLIGYLVNYLNKENLQKAINENIDLFNLICNHYALTSPTILPLFKAAARAYWQEFEEAVTNVPRIYTLLMKNQENAPILQTPQAIQYLNTQCENLYLQMYNLVWS